MEKVKIGAGNVQAYASSSAANTAKTLTLAAKTGLRAQINKVIVTLSGTAGSTATTGGFAVDIKEGTAATTIASLSIPSASVLGYMLNVDFPGGLRATTAGNKLDVVVAAGGTGITTNTTVLGDYSA